MRVGSPLDNYRAILPKAQRKSAAFWVLVSGEMAKPQRLI